MNLRPDEITGIIKEQIKNYSSKLELKDIGTCLLYTSDAADD